MIKNKKKVPIVNNYQILALQKEQQSYVIKTGKIHTPPTITKTTTK